MWAIFKSPFGTNQIVLRKKYVKITKITKIWQYKKYIYFLKQMNYCAKVVNHKIWYKFSITIIVWTWRIKLTCQLRCTVNAIKKPNKQFQNCYFFFILPPKKWNEKYGNQKVVCAQNVFTNENYSYYFQKKIAVTQLCQRKKVMALRTRRHKNNFFLFNYFLTRPFTPVLDPAHFLSFLIF